MKKLLLFFLSSFFLGSLLSAQVKLDCSKPSNKKVDKAMKSLWQTSCRELSVKRLDAMDVMQCAANNLTHSQFNLYQKSSDEQVVDDLASDGIIRYLDKSFSKILNEVKTVQVPLGSVALWQVYNMGYVVKTPTACFGIDIKHRRSEELLPYIDFLLITHKHGDHYTQRFMDAMYREGKPVVSNFSRNGIIVQSIDTLLFGDIQVVTRIIDHNKQLTNFVVGYEIDCGKQTNNCTVMHIGDGCNANQLNPTRTTDIFIYNVRVGLNVQKAVELLQPEVTLLSHVLELSHDMKVNRWPYTLGVERAKGVNWRNVWMPMWGELFVYKKE